MSASEAVLLKRFASNGDAEAFAEIVKQHAPLVYGVCLRILEDKDKAADAVQDTFFQLVRNAANISGSLTIWLHRVATNRAIDLIRQDSQRKQRESQYATEPEIIESNQENATWQEISVYVDQELNKLDDQMREVLILHFLQGKTTREIAKKCGISHQTVSRRIEAGIASLRHKLRLRGIIAPSAVLAAMLSENMVKAAPAQLMEELGKMAIAGGASIGAKITVGVTASAVVKAKIITIAAIALIAVGSAVIYSGYNQFAEPATDIRQAGLATIGNTSERAKVDEPVTLEMVRGMVEHNEALINPIKMNYTVTLRREGDFQLPASAGSRIIGGRTFTHSECIWAQDGDKHYAKVQSLYGPNEPARGSIYVFNEKITTMGELPDLKYGGIHNLDFHDWYYVMVTKLGLRPFEGEQRLSELLVPEYASINNKTEVINGRETYVIDVRQHEYSNYFARIWLDKQRGIPVQIWYYGKHPAWGDQKSISQINDIELYQLPNGAWLPVKGVRSIDFTNYISYEYISVDVNSITTRREDIPQSLFAIDFPDGASIYNAITGLRTIKGKPLKSYEQIIKAGGHYISGAVVDVNNVPVQDVVIEPVAVITKLDDGQTSQRLIQNYEGICAVSDSKGRFAVELKEEGLYEFEFYPKNFADMYVNNIPFDKHDLKVIIEKGGTISGRVVHFIKGEKIPVANIGVTVTDKGGHWASFRTSLPIPTTTDIQGRFQFRNLSTHLQPRSSEEQPQYRPRSWDISCGSATQSITFDEGVNSLEAELVLKPNPAEAAPLAGRALPAFDGIKINLDAQQTKDNRLLICFFDMSQRVARNCIIELNKQANRLRQQGITVIGIQMEDVNAEEFNQWVRQSDFKVPVGTIQTDIDEIKFNWSIQSLPWLILTDKQHKVIAEGFAITELDKITETGN
jgi:RNA polymerase sigma factor (sigma-70 family)